MNKPYIVEAIRAGQHHTTMTDLSWSFIQAPGAPPVQVANAKNILKVSGFTEDRTSKNNRMRFFGQQLPNVARYLISKDDRHLNNEAYCYIPPWADLPNLYGTEHQRIEDKVIHVKIFDPSGSWTWYIVEYDYQKDLAWGLVHGFEKEWGYIDMNEIRTVRGRFGLPLERDIWWEPQTVREAEEIAW